jgi:hypothetical protein
LPIVDLFVVVIQGEKIAVGANESNLIFYPSELDTERASMMLFRQNIGID